MFCVLVFKYSKPKALSAFKNKLFKSFWLNNKESNVGIFFFIYSLVCYLIMRSFYLLNFDRLNPDTFWLRKLLSYALLKERCNFPFPNNYEFL